MFIQGIVSDSYSLLSYWTLDISTYLVGAVLVYTFKMHVYLYVYTKYQITISTGLSSYHKLDIE